MMDMVAHWLQRLIHGDPAALAVLVEWLMIGVAVYAILRFLRGTRGASLFRGVALLLLTVTIVVKLIAQTFHLERILAIYPTFVFGVFLIAIIVFQPELRRALMRLGATGWLPGLTQDVHEVVDELIQSVGYLSRNKIGCLIALERGTELGGLIASGCKIDAEVSAALLNTIFWPGSALHDMGVIISQGRVAAAAVPFPLTESDIADPSMGSRHRAALGLSEESDALIVIVSEETGTISLCEHGRLTRHLTPEDLREMLGAGLARPMEEPVAAEPEPSTEPDAAPIDEIGAREEDRASESQEPPLLREPADEPVHSHTQA